MRAVPAENGLPNLLIIGAAKAGTRSLYHYLGQHPQIFMSPVKEPRYFAFDGDLVDFRGPGDGRFPRDVPTTLEAYRELFQDVRDQPVVGEASVLYLDHPRAPEAIARHIPEVRLIAILRNPVERAYSQFLFHRLHGIEPLADFADALSAEPGRIADNWYHAWRYRERGFYHRHLRRYFERFDPGQIRIYLYEELYRDPLSTLEDIFRFLGIDDGFRPTRVSRHNYSGEPRSPRLHRLLTRSHPVKVAKSVLPGKHVDRLLSWLQRGNLVRPTLRAETRADLLDGYREDIRRLEDLIGRDLSHWLH